MTTNSTSDAPERRWTRTRRLPPNEYGQVVELYDDGYRIYGKWVSAAPINGPTEPELIMEYKHCDFPSLAYAAIDTLMTNEADQRVHQQSEDDQRLKEIRKRRAKVAPPWHVSSPDNVNEFRIESRPLVLGDAETVEAHCSFIEHAPDDIDYLLSLTDRTLPPHGKEPK